MVAPILGTPSGKIVPTGSGWRVVDRREAFGGADRRGECLDFSRWGDAVGRGGGHGFVVELQPSSEVTEVGAYAVDRDSEEVAVEDMTEDGIPFLEVVEVAGLACVRDPLIRDGDGERASMNDRVPEVSAVARSNEVSRIKPFWQSDV